MILEYDELTGEYVDTETGVKGYSKTDVKANIKREKFGIVKHPWVSNRFVLCNLKLEGDDGI